MHLEFDDQAQAPPYKLTEQDRWIGPKIDKVVGIVPLRDQTAPSANKVLRIDEASWRTNYRKGYKDGELASNVTAMISKHLAHSGLFKKVVLGGEQACDLQLSGTLKDYMAMGRIHSTEGIQAGTAGFGLIGALIGVATTANMKTEIRASVTLDDLKLIDTATGSPVWTGALCLSNNFSANFQAADQRAVFHHADALLKDAVTEMIQKIGTAQKDNVALSQKLRARQQSEKR